MEDIGKFILFLSYLWDYPRKDFIGQGLDILSHLGFNTHDLNIQTLQEEYVRLFINAPSGVPAPPYASVYLTGMVAQEPALEALSFYERVGLRPEGSDPPDHLSWELAFIAHLIEREQKELLREFLEQHFWRWFPRFKGALLAASPHPFYRNLLEVTEQVLQNIKED